MKIKLTISTNREGYTVHRVSGRINFHIELLSDCPEDAIIGRDLIDGLHLIDAARLGYEAGKAGESFDVEVIEE